MKWWRELIDRWRRGPEVRALQAEVAEKARAVAHASGVVARMSHQLKALAEFLNNSGMVKIRCRRCGDLTWKWMLHFPDDGHVFATCDACSRALAKASQNGQPTQQSAAHAPAPVEGHG